MAIQYHRLVEFVLKDIQVMELVGLLVVPPLSHQGFELRGQGLLQQAKQVEQGRELKLHTHAHEVERLGVVVVAKLLVPHAICVQVLLGKAPPASTAA